MSRSNKKNNPQVLEKYFKNYNLFYPFEINQTKLNPYTKIEIKTGNKKTVTSLFRSALHANDLQLIDFIIDNYKPTKAATLGLQNQKEVLIQDLLVNQQPQIAQILLTKAPQAFNNIIIDSQQNHEIFTPHRRHFCNGNYQLISFLFGFTEFDDFLVKNKLSNFNYHFKYSLTYEKDINFHAKKIAIIIGGHSSFIDKYLNHSNIKEPISFSNSDYFSADLLLGFLHDKKSVFYPTAKKYYDQLTLIYALQHILGENRANFNPNLKNKADKNLYFYTGKYENLEINLLTLSIFTRNLSTIQKIKPYFSEQQFEQSCRVAQKIAPFLDLCYKEIATRSQEPLILFNQEVNNTIEYLQLDKNLNKIPSSTSPLQKV